jgi:uncharacterized membrane protein (UPF0127 family)
MAEAAPAERFPTSARVVTLIDDGGRVVCERCTVADTMFTRMRGLLGRRELPAGEGMLIRPAPSVMTFFMLFPIDVVFLDRDGNVLKVREHMKPWRTASCRRAHMTLELAAGEAGRRGVAPGDRLLAETPGGG